MFPQRENRRRSFPCGSDGERCAGQRAKGGAVGAGAGVPQIFQAFPQGAPETGERPHGGRAPCPRGAAEPFRPAFCRLCHEGGLFQNLREQGRHGILKTAPAIRGGGRETGHKGIPDAPSDNGAMEKRADLRNRERTEQRVHGRMQYDHQDVETGMLRVQEF